MKISFIIPLKNRIKLPYINNNNTEYLYLLGNNLNSLKNIIKLDDLWEFIIVDFGSTDVINVNTFLKSILDVPNITYKIITLNEAFNRGKGLNIGFENCSHDIIFCYDADMMIHTYKLFDDIQKYVVEEQNAFFPICWSYHDHTHKTGWKRDTGKGNVIVLKKYYNNYIEKTTWGGEDDINYAHFKNNNKVVREFYEDKFVHQWHPSTEWKSKS